jgi:integrase
VRRGTKKRREKMLAVEAPEFARWLGEHVPKDRRLGEPMAPLFSNPDAIKATKGTRVPLGWWSETALRRTWTNACRRAGAPAVSLYAGTKHTLGTALKDRGVDDATLAELFGHADQRSVRPYRLIRPSAVRGALRRLEE